MISYQVPEVEIRQIALGCIYLQAKRALLAFPTSTRAAPSGWVVISRGNDPPLGIGDDRVFPLKVRWDVWQNQIVPLLRGDGQDLWDQSMKGGYPDWELLKNGWEGLLGGAFNPGTSSESIATTSGSSSGEPVRRTELPETGLYPIVDPQLAWLVYPTRDDPVE